MRGGAKRGLRLALAASVVASGLAVSSGVAVADETATCLDGITVRTVDASLVTLDGEPCTSAALDSLKDLLPTSSSVPALPTTTPPPPVAEKTTTPKPAAVTPSRDATVPPVVVQEAGPGVAVAQAPAVGLSPASGVLPGASLSTSAGFAPVALASGIYDPALLLGPGAPTASLQTLGGNPASAVTSASQIQAMALNASTPLGIGATVGIVILAGLGGLVLRQRLLRRVNKAATSS